MVGDIATLLLMLHLVFTEGYPKTGDIEATSSYHMIKLDFKRCYEQINCNTKDINYHIGIKMNNSSQLRLHLL